VRLDVQILAADRAEAGAVGCVQDLIGQARGRSRRAPSGELELVVDDVLAAQLDRLARLVAWYSRTSIEMSTTASVRQRMHGPCRRTSNASRRSRPVVAWTIVSSLSTSCGTGR
jgi:hypothetical protein